MVQSASNTINKAVTNQWGGIQAAGQGAAPVVQREIITKEMVKVPCRFCGTLNANIGVRCPGCYAPTR